MRLAVVTLLLASGLLASSVAAAAPEPDAITWDGGADAGTNDDTDIDAGPSDAGAEAGFDGGSGIPVTFPPSSSSSSSSSGSTGRPTPPMPLPSGGRTTHEPAPAYYYEGQSCSSDGYYEETDSCSGDTYDTYGDDVVHSGDDDDSSDTSDDSSDDDDDGWDTSDTDDDDDDDDSWSSLTPRDRHEQVEKVAKRTPTRKGSSPMSRYALLGVLLAFPLRRLRKKS